MRNTLEEFDWLVLKEGKSRKDAIPFLKFPTTFKAASVTGAAALLCWFDLLNRRQAMRLKEKHIRRQKPENVSKANAYNNRPDVAAKRHAYYKNKRLTDPVWAADLNRQGVERFKANKEHIYKLRAEWKKKNPDYERNYIREWTRHRRRTDPQYRIGNRLRSRIWHAIEAATGKKATSTTELMGCSIEQARRHLEGLFTKGMSWANMGKWAIDHVVPCARFDLTQESEQRRCFHFSNLQPMWRAENQAKSAKIVACQPELLLAQ